MFNVRQFTPYVHGSTVYPVCSCDRMPCQCPVIRLVRTESDTNICDGKTRSWLIVLMMIYRCFHSHPRSFATDLEGLWLWCWTWSNLGFLCEMVWRCCGDGTFKAAPKLWTQLYTIHHYTSVNTIHGQRSGYTVYLVCSLFTLLPNKRKEAYIRFFRHIKSWIDVNGKNWQFDSLLSDFEKGEIDALLQISLRRCGPYLIGLPRDPPGQRTPCIQL